MKKFIDLTGRIFGRLEVIAYKGKDKWSHSLWECVCNCSKKLIINGRDLLNGNTRSCGCLRKEIISIGKFAIKHGHTMNNKISKTYNAWHSIIQRCTNPKNKYYKDYGGRGIKVCERWLKFENFLEDVGEIPIGKEIDRVNNNKGYNPYNFRIINKKGNNRNKRNNHLIPFNNKKLTIIEWSEITGINKRTILTRIRSGWSPEKTLTTPVKKHKKYKKKNNDA